MELRIVRHGLVDSTSERAFAALAEGSARDGDVHVAVGQTAGRGRRGATWHSPPGEGLYLSAILLPPPPGCPPEAPSIAGALAVRAVLAALGVEGTVLKWPNDVEADGAKLAGVLVESRGFDPGRPHFVVGIGLDVRQRSFPEELARERAVTSLALLGFDVPVAAAEAALLPLLAERLELCRTDPELLAVEYLAASGLAGERVRAAAGTRVTEGVLTGLSLAGGVSISTPEGAVVSHPLGHVRALARAFPAPGRAPL